MSQQRLRLATVWLAGCSGCHMALLDLDVWLFELARWADIVYSPLASDIKVFPEAVDVTLVEGAVANTDNLAMAQRLRQCSRTVVALGDCAVSGNVPALRNLWSRDAVLNGVYGAGAAETLADSGVVPQLLERVLPLHALIAVDLFVPGCPPPAARIRAALESLRCG